MSLLYVRPKVVFRHGAIFGKTIRPEYTVSCRTLSIAYSDRTQTLDFGFPYAIADSLPDFTKPCDLSFRDITKLRAREIISLSERLREPLVVFWSGGIDSTLALTALLQEGVDPANVRVLYSESSVEEYPLYFETVIQNKIQCELLTELVSYEIDTGISVTGELGDQIFGLLLTSLNEDGTDFEALTQDYRPWFLHRLEQGYQTLLSINARDDLKDHFGHCPPSEVAAQVLEYLEPQFQKAPNDIRTVHDLLWWIQISLKWQPKSLEDIGAIHNGEQTERIQHFFQTPEYQLWSFHNYRNAIQDSWVSYKWHAKEIIREFTGDDYYAESKTKHNSKQHVTQDVPGAVAKRKNYKALSQDGSIMSSLTTEEPKHHARENNGVLAKLGKIVWSDPESQWASEKWATHTLQGRFDRDDYPETLNFSDSAITDDDLNPAVRLQRLRALFLNDTDITDQGVRHLTSCALLRGVGLSGTHVTDNVVSILREFPKLYSLVLSFTQLSDQGMKAIAEIHTLRRVWVDYTSVSSDGLMGINKLKDLSLLSLRRTQVTDEGLESLQSLAHLKRLYLDECAITPKGVCAIQRYDSLEELRCCGTNLTEEVLPELRKYRELKVLDLSLTRITQTAVAQLRQELPGTAIYR